MQYIHNVGYITYIMNFNFKGGDYHTQLTVFFRLYTIKTNSIEHKNTLIKIATARKFSPVMQ